MFGILDYSAFVAAFVLLLFIPGPGNFALIASTGRGGLRGGLASVFGLLLGDQVLLWLAVAGVSIALTANLWVFWVLRVAGAIYLAWLGFRLLVANASDVSAVDFSHGHYFRQTMWITLLNPKSIMFFVAFFPQFIDPAQSWGAVTFAAMAATVAVLGFVYCFGVVLVAHYAAERFKRYPVLGSALQKLAGVFLIGFGVRLALGK